jgi:hypothetical protein
MGFDHQELCTIYFSALENIHYVLCSHCSGKRRSSSDQGQGSFQKAKSLKCFPCGILKGPAVSEIAVPNYGENPRGGKYTAIYGLHGGECNAISKSSISAALSFAMVVIEIP